MSIPLLAATILWTGTPVDSAPQMTSLPISAVSEGVSAPLQSSPAASAAPARPADQQEIVVTGKSGPVKSDPLAKLNEQSFEVTQAVDRAVVRPAAMTYRRIFPQPVRDGVRNFLNNLREPVAFLNFLLQIKPGKAVQTFGRFAINSTIGVGGLIDVATRGPFRIKRRVNGLANTMGFYGIKPGAYLFLPLVGPTTVRDLIGDTLDRLVVPLSVGKPFNKPYYSIPMGTASSLDQRSQFDESLEELHTAGDPYAATREDYLAKRQAAIDELHGKRPESAIPPAPPKPVIF